MILGEVSNAKQYQSIHPLFAEAFDFITHTNLSELAVGKTIIKGDSLFALVSKNGTGVTEAPKLEVHRKYIDIHFAIAGSDLISWRSLTDCKEPMHEFRQEDDYQLFNDKRELSIHINDKKFVILFPEDAHAPLIETKDLIKLVIKVKV